MPRRNYEDPTIPWDDPDPISRACAALTNGATLSGAARAAGITPDTLTRQLHRARQIQQDLTDQETGLPTRAPTEAEERLLRLHERIQRAQGVAELTLTARWMAATRTDWRAAQALLASHHPGEYQPPTRVEHTGTLDSTIRIDSVAALTAELDSRFADDEDDTPT